MCKSRRQLLICAGFILFLFRRSPLGSATWLRATSTTVNFSANWFYFVGFEMAIVLLIACFVFLAHIRGLRKLISALEGKVLAQRDSIRTTRATFDVLKGELQTLRIAASRGYSDFVGEQLDTTRNRHVGLSPDRDIVLDIATDTPLERQILALRHAFLIAEQEAALAADNKGIDWDVLEAKLGQILDFYQQSSSLEPELEIDDADVDTEAGTDAASDDQQQRHIANLEKFRKLYFDVERKWREARAEAERYHQELSALGQSLGAGEEFDALLNQYVQVYAGVDGLLEEGGREPGDDTPEQRPSVGHIVVANQEEIQRLRNMAVDQHKIILELKRQLVDADSLEAKDRLIEEMNTQLDRNQRFLKESDTCIQQLEADLSHLLTENQSLKAAAQAAGVPTAAAPVADVGADEGSNDELELLRGLVTSFTGQSRDMLGAIAVLEEDNRKLMAQRVETPGVDVGELKARLAQTQQELLKLQTQYLELEERYLELKLQTS